MNWLLLLCGIIIIVFALIGNKRGLVRVLFSLAAYVITIVLVGIISPIVGDILETKTGVREPIYTKCNEMVLEYSADSDLSTLNTGIETIEKFKLPGVLKDYMKAELSEEHIGEKFVSYISNKMTDVVMNAIAFAISFVLILIVLKVIGQVLDLVTKLPVIHFANHLGGTIAGGLEGVLIVWCIFLLITLFCTTAWGHVAMEMIAESKVLSWLYRNNILLHFLSLK